MLKVTSSSPHAYQQVDVYSSCDSSITTLPVQYYTVVLYVLVLTCTVFDRIDAAAQEVHTRRKKYSNTRSVRGIRSQQKRNGSA